MKKKSHLARMEKEQGRRDRGKKNENSEWKKIRKTGEK